MRAGLFRFPIVIWTETAEKGLAGATKKTWTVFVNTKANIVNMGGRKGEKDEQISNSRITEFIVRYNVQVTESMRVVYGGQIYKINYINPYILENRKVIGCEFVERA